LTIYSIFVKFIKFYNYFYLLNGRGLLPFSLHIMLEG